MKNRLLLKAFWLTIKVWRQYFHMAFIWSGSMFCFMLWGISIDHSLILSVLLGISPFFVEWYDSYRKLVRGIEQIRDEENNKNN